MKYHPLFRSSIVIFLRKNFFSSFLNSMISVIGFFILLKCMRYLWEFCIATSWLSDGIDPCLDQVKGLCIPYIKAQCSNWIYGLYPIALRWRLNVCFFILFLNIVPIVFPLKFKLKLLEHCFFILISSMIFFIFLRGGIFGLQMVEVSRIGGLFLTFLISFVVIPLSIPIGVLLALGRQSNTLHLISGLCVMCIEICRGVPLVTILFVSSVMFPMFLPQDLVISKLLRAMGCITLFASCYMAETIRGGLQSISKGQYEAAKSLGLKPWQCMYSIILPQTFKKVMPGITNNFISIFKDSSLVLIIGLLDFLGMVKLTSTDGHWATPVTATTGYLVAGCTYWIFCFTMSTYSHRIERKLDY